MIDHWWQTETGLVDRRRSDGRRTRCRSSPARRPCRCLAYDVRILRADGTECDAGEEGAICVKLPLPPGTLADTVGRRRPLSWRRTCPNFPGYYLTGDGGYFDEDGYLFVMGRTDDVINVAGHRLSTGAIEAVLATHPAVAECAVIGVADEIKGQVPRGFVVLKAGASDEGLAERARRRRAGQHRCGGQLQAGRRRRRAAEDALGKDPAQDDARHRRRPRRTPAVDHRGRRRCSTS